MCTQVIGYWKQFREDASVIMHCVPLQQCESLAASNHSIVEARLPQGNTLTIKCVERRGLVIIYIVRHKGED